MIPINVCECCGSSRIATAEILWNSLIDEWELAPYESEYINRQQGLHCLDCLSNLRSMALAIAVMRFFNYEGLFKDFVTLSKVQSLRILELNEAGGLTKFLSQMDGHQLGLYPDVDMMDLPFDDETFDIVIHSDTLEHVSSPTRGLSECHRVLKPSGFCAFTVPIVVDRMTRSRTGLPPSYHDNGESRSDYLVHTEYGCDVWKQVIQAGFEECRIHSLEYPTAQALVAVKSISRKVPNMEFTGERYVPQMSGHIKYEHLHRYAISLDFVREKSVLDLASGEGYGAAILSSFASSVVGVDIDPDSISHAQNQYAHLENLCFMVGTCDSVPLPSGSVDIVTSFETIEHHDKHEEMMLEVTRVLKPEGLLVISSPNRLVHSDEADHSNPFHVKELYYDEFIDLLSHHFKYIQVYGQRIAAGSFVFPLQGDQTSSLKAYTGESNNLANKACGLNSPLYFLALCSNEETALSQNLSSVYINRDDDLLKLINDQQIQLSEGWRNSQLHLEQTQSQLGQTQSQLGQTQSQLEQTRSQLEQTQQSMALLQEQKDLMESSKFWKLRKFWFRLKRIFGLK